MIASVNTTKTLEFFVHEAFADKKNNYDLSNTKCKVRVVVIMIVTNIIILLRV